MRFSEKEVAMFSELGVDQDDLKFMTANRAYQAAAWNVVCEGKTGPAVDSLRRCLNGWGKDSDLWRETPEWDDLICLERPQMSDEMCKFFSWLRDRFVYILGENPNTEIVRKMAEPKRLSKADVEAIYDRLVNLHKESTCETHVQKVLNLLRSM